MEVKLLYFEDCPSWKIADQHLTEILAEKPGLSVGYQLVHTDEDAVRFQFLGSPSFTVDGKDLFAEPGQPVGLSCRIYQTSQGPAGSPSLDQLRAAIESVSQ